MFIPILGEDGANLTCDLVHIFYNSPTTDAVCPTVCGSESILWNAEQWLSDLSS